MEWYFLQVMIHIIEVDLLLFDLGNYCMEFLIENSIDELIVLYVLI